jgi:alginate O-acetyltransferase complex protein AlgI
LYISLGGNRGGRWKTYRNLMATMTLGGLWHGAAWNFVLWGAFQGGLLAMHRALAGAHKRVGEGVQRTFRTSLLRLGMIALFFQVVCYGWLLFRAASFGQIVDFSGRLLGIVSAPSTISVPSPPLAALLAMGVLFVWDLMVERTGNVQFYARWPLAVRAFIFAAMVYLLAFGATTATSAFIYFQF